VSRQAESFFKHELARYVTLLLAAECTFFKDGFIFICFMIVIHIMMLNMYFPVCRLISTISSVKLVESWSSWTSMPLGAALAR
jgi:hypothetical protein